MTGPPAERARLFVALDLPTSARQALVQWRGSALEPADSLRLVAPAFMHVTLCFLGWQPVDKLEEILAACRTVADHRAMELALGAALWLPRRRPRVLAVGLDEIGGKLAGTQEVLSRALAAGGWYVPEKRPFLAHVTVARVPSGVRLQAPELPPPPPVRFEASRITLYRSRLGAGGARYEALGTIELGG